ncbi:MAG: hypothetical protein E7039_04665 [Lentisphaerae bacterium]|nr:hypothetical protein [Lentisphaerota bacterium]
MKKLIVLFAAVAAVTNLSAVDFDFTGSAPAAKGKVPMPQLPAFVKIGGTAGKSALHLDGSDKAVAIPGSGHFTLDKGITVAFDMALEKKENNPKNLQMLAMKTREWLIGKEKNRLYINFHDGKKWMPGYYCNADFSKPHRYVITISKELKINIWCDGKLYHNGSMQSWMATPAVGKNNVSLGCGWTQWGIKGDIYRLRIAEGVLSDDVIKGF